MMKFMCVNKSFKTSETLLGIETFNFVISTMAVIALMLQNLWNPFRDWNKLGASYTGGNNGFKTSETLLGIETDWCY